MKLNKCRMCNGGALSDICNPCRLSMANKRKRFTPNSDNVSEVIKLRMLRLGWSTDKVIEEAGVTTNQFLNLRTGKLNNVSLLSFNNVCKTLGLDPRLVLTEAYKNGEHRE